MPTEASVYEQHLANIIGTLERRVMALENSSNLTPEDEIELTALDFLLEQLDGLDDYGSGD